MTTRYTKAEREQARARLLDIIEPGDIIYTVLRDVSRDGMNRTIVPYLLPREASSQARPLWLAYNVARACDYRYDERREGVRVGGCGMDMGFALVYDLAYTLWPDGFACLGAGRDCPSSDHSNGAKPHKGKHHRDAGYALRQRWL